MQNQQYASKNGGGLIQQNPSQDIDQYLFSDENFNGQNSLREVDKKESQKSVQNSNQQQILIQYEQNKHKEAENSSRIHQEDMIEYRQDEEELENEDNQHDEFYNEGSQCNSNDNDSCLESKSLQNFNKQNKEKRLKTLQLQQQQQEFKMKSLPDRQTTSVDKGNMNYVQSSMNYCNKTRDEIQEIIEGIPYPDQLSMTSISNSTHSYVGSTPQRNILESNDFRQSKKSLKRGSFNRFNNEMQRILPNQLHQNGRKIIHSKTEEQDDAHMKDVRLDWSKQILKAGDDKNIFPQIFAPSVEMSNEDSMILKMSQSGNEMNHAQKVNLATFGGFDTRHDEDIEDDYDGLEDGTVTQNTGSEIEHGQKRMERQQNQFPNQYDYHFHQGPYMQSKEDVKNEGQYYIEDNHSQIQQQQQQQQQQFQQRQFDQISKRNSNIIDHSRSNIQNNNASIHTQNNNNNNSKSVNLIDKSVSQNFSLQEEQSDMGGYQNNSDNDNGHYNDDMTSNNNTYIQQQQQQQSSQYNQKMRFSHYGHSQMDYNDNQINASYISVPQQDQSVLQHLQQQQNQTINLLRKSDDESAMRIQISQLSMEKNQIMNKVQQLVHQASKLEQEKNYQASQIEDLNQELKFLKEKYKDNGNLEKLRGRELETERQNNKRLKQLIEQKNEKIQSLFDEMQKLEQQREAYIIEFQQQREIKQIDQQVLLECQLQMQSIQEENDRLIIKIEELETELQTKDFNIENMRQTYQQREKLINSELNKIRMQYDKDMFSLKQEIQILNKAKELEKQRMQLKEESLSNDGVLKQMVAHLNEEVEELKIFNSRKDKQVEIISQEYDLYQDEVRQTLLQNFSYWIKTEEFNKSEFPIMIEILRSFVQELKYENEGLSHSVKQNNKQKIDKVSELRKLKNENGKLKDEVLNLSTLNDDKVNISGISKGVVDDKNEATFFNEQIDNLNNQLFKQRLEYELQIENVNKQYMEQMEIKQDSIDQTKNEMENLQKQNQSLQEEISQLRQMTKTGQNIINELESKLKKQLSQSIKNSSQSSQLSFEQTMSNQELELKNMQRQIQSEKKKLNSAQLKFEEDIQQKYEQAHLKEQDLAQRERDLQFIQQDLNSQKEALKVQHLQQQPSKNSGRINSQDSDQNIVINQNESDQTKGLQVSLRREIQEKDLLKIENDHLIEQIENKVKEIQKSDSVIKQLEEKIEKQERILKEEKKKTQELQRENKVLLDNINHLRTNYEKMQTQLQTSVNQLNHKQQELHQQITNIKKLSKTNKNLSQTNLELLSKIQNLNDQMSHFEKERHFTSQPSPIFHNKAKSCQYTGKGMQEVQKQKDGNDQIRKRNISVNSASSNKPDKSLLYLIQNTLNNSSQAIRQSTFPNDYSHNQDVLDADKGIVPRLHQTHPSQNNLSLESYYHNAAGNNTHLNTSSNQNTNKNRQNSYKNLISSVLPLALQSNKNNTPLQQQPSSSSNVFEPQIEDVLQSQNQDQQSMNYLNNNFTQKRKDENPICRDNNNFIMSPHSCFNQVPKFNRIPSSISDALQIQSLNSCQQKQRQVQQNLTQSQAQQDIDDIIQYKNIDNQNINKEIGQNHLCKRCNSQVNNLIDEHQYSQQIETESRFLAMKEQVDNYELEFNQMKEYFIHKLKDVNTTIKDLELKSNILEKENKELREFKADYLTEVNKLEQQKAIVERQIYNAVMSQKRITESQVDENSSSNGPLTITPEMLSAEETLELMQEILRKVVKSNEMKKILTKSSDFKNLIQLMSQQQYQSSQQSYNSVQFNTSYRNNNNNNNNNQSVPVISDIVNNYQSTASTLPQYYQPIHSQIQQEQNAKTKRVVSNAIYLNNSCTEPYLLQQRANQNQNQSLANLNDTRYNNQPNCMIQQNSNSLIINPANNQYEINKQLFKQNENKPYSSLQKLLEEQNKKLLHSNSVAQYQSARGFQSQQIYPKNTSQSQIYPFQINPHLLQQNHSQYQLKSQNNYFAQDQNIQSTQSPSNSYVLNYYNKHGNSSQNLPLSSRREKKQQFLSLDQNMMI